VERRPDQEIEAEGVTPDLGRPYHRTTSNLDVLVPVDSDALPEISGSGSNALRLVEAAGVERQRVVDSKELKAFSLPGHPAKPPKWVGVGTKQVQLIRRHHRTMNRSPASRL
jgi:hypothetical protein